MKNLNPKALNRNELAKIKGGTDNCPAVWAECDPNCGHFQAYYSAYVTCVDAHSTMCSPLEGWGNICGNYN